MARALIDRGFHRVRPLAGGLDAWVQLGFPVEPIEVVAASSTLPVAGQSQE